MDDIAVTTVGVVVPAYNASRYISSTLQSIFGQSGVKVTCVVSDDGSTDGTADIVRNLAERDSRFVLISGRNGGQSVARNRGLEAIADEVDFVCFCDADDLLMPGSLAALARHVPEDGCGAFGYATLIDADGLEVPSEGFIAAARRRPRVVGHEVRFEEHNGPTRVEDLIASSMIFPPAVALVRTTVATAVGGFERRLRRASEWPFFARCAAHGGRLHSLISGLQRTGATGAI